MSDWDTIKQMKENGTVPTKNMQEHAITAKMANDEIKEAELRGFMRAVEMLRSAEAIIEAAYKTEPEQWADWLEERKP